MKIAQVAPLYESVPPRLYGGTERVVSYLTEELIRQGHHVTLFASGDSTTSATLVAPCPRALRLDPTCHDSLAYHVVMLDEVYRRADDFDVIHFHIDYLHFPVSARTSAAHVTTLHGRLDLPELARLYRQFPEMPLISISQAQRRPLPWANWIATVGHGLPARSLSLGDHPQHYLAFLGRISPEKGADRAIEIAKQANMPLRIAAKIDRVDQQYFDARIRPLLDHPLIEFVGEISEQEKQQFLGQAYALLFPIEWPEPFGLAMIEAMGCGTPIIAFRRGSVPEVLDDGLTGFIVDTVEQAVAAIPKIETLSRNACRAVFEQRFTAAQMARNYLAQYALIQARDERLLASPST